ncbi:(2Fe-2S) ferredoxin domain-containing protein [Nocardioides flavescens]|uniref:(2Fe-2S) ferredoxin domain-containing protein n=1 Tax=Nocardioides flavescens TaxID=2691959 RepID=A0A6L7F4H4_9ACTN|nr:(2Fe-2S) ferredoxin domain-containing protein [Nocardioides flavescens]MXG92199.1 (2Fe-2S) ferredoxin domain-containing protein [Nocardioides flavescens]
MSVREVDASPLLQSWADALPAASVAHLQLGGPSLHRTLDAYAATGVARVRLVGVSLGTFAPGHSWLRRIAGHWVRTRTVGEGPAVPVIEVADALVGERPDLDDVTFREVSGAEPGLTSPAWADVPAYRHQVLVCRGPRCTAQASDASAEALVLELMAQGLGDDDVLVTHTGCLFPCNHAPVVAVQPDDVWYAAVDPTTARRIVTDHLVGDRPLEDAHRLTRATSTTQPRGTL